MSDTIAAIATAGGTGSIAIIRLSGADAVPVASTIAPKAKLHPREAELSPIYDSDNNLIDRAVLIYFQSPRSFTGEDIVEIQCHGGQVVADIILDVLLKNGARIAEPGEFSKRAFLNGKIDLSEAEAIARLIEAKSADAARILARQLKGGLGELVSEVREQLVRALAHSEVMIDYAEDIPEDVTDSLITQLSDLRKKIDRIVSSSKRRRGLIEGFRVSIVGKPNVGKSSLLNAMLDMERAIVSDVAGTTRDTIEEQVRVRSHLIRLIDTAGIRDSDDAIEQIGVERSLASIDDADIVIAMFDGSREFDQEDEQFISILKGLHDKEVIAIVNKKDLDGSFEASGLESFAPLLKLSAKEDISPLVEKIGSLLDGLATDDETMLVSARQIEAVEACSRAILDALGPLKNGELEIFSYHINEAISHISSITHPYENDQMLDQMFGEFCLGK